MTGRSFRLRALVLAVLVTLGAAGSAHGAGCVGRPGASALDQYCEAVPTAGGGRQNPGTGSGAGVSAQTNQSLQAAGQDGAAVAALAGGSTSSSGGGTPRAGRDEPSVARPSDPSGSPLSAAAHAVSSGPTAGPLLAWALVGIALLGAGVVVMRRRGPSGPTSGA